MFTGYRFGEIIYKGGTYRCDLWIDTKGSAHRRGDFDDDHLLEARELVNYLEPATKKVVVGTGYSGVMEIADDARELLKQRGIALVAVKSGEAVQLYNREQEKSATTVLIHSTC